jgi:hypothetical protein
MNDAKNRRAVDRVVGLLEAGVAGAVAHDALEAAVEEDFRRYDGARITVFVPVLVENDIRGRILRSRAN